MFKIKKYRKESTDPAQLVDSVEQAARQAKENLAWLIAGVVVAVLAGAAVGGFLWMRQQDDRAAADLFYEATQQAFEPSQTGAPLRRVVRRTCRKPSRRSGRSSPTFRTARSRPRPRICWEMP